MTDQFKSSANRSRRGFTIVELVTVIAVLGILVGILVPGFTGAAERFKMDALRIELKSAYTQFSADCDFRNESFKTIDKYTFLPEANMSASATVTGNGYTWNGKDNSNPATKSKGSISLSGAGIYGPFSGYYLIISGEAGSISGGSGTAASPYSIDSYKELRAIAEAVARGESTSGKHYKLNKDIIIPDSFWLPIGGFSAPGKQDSAKAFAGVFDGNGHTITIQYDRVARDSYSLFGQINGATIKNLKVEGTLDVGAYAGGIVAVAKGASIIENCENAAYVAGDHHVGGIVGKADGTTKIIACKNTGNVEAFSMIDGVDNAIGGIVGEATASVVVESCYNTGNVSGLTGTVGGIAGIARGKVTACRNDGMITSKGYSTQNLSGTAKKDALTGGIVGWGAGTATIDGCMNTGKVSATLRCVGGIVGANASQIKNCSNTAQVSGQGWVGGIVGYNKTTVVNVRNSGNVSATSTGPVGGIIGQLNYSGTYALKYVANTGSVTGSTTTEKGMLIGSANCALTLTNAYISSGTAIGKCSGTAPAATVQSNQDTFSSAINEAIGSTYAKWVKINNIFQPIRNYTVTYNMGALPAGRTVELMINTSFVGGNKAYLPYPKTLVVIDGDYKYTFNGWYTAKTGGTKITDPSTLSASKTIYAQWTKSAHVMAPIPFG